MLDILWMILKTCLPWLILSLIGKVVKAHVYTPFMEKKEEVYNTKLRGISEKLLLYFVSFLMIGTLMGFGLLPEVAKHSMLQFLRYTLEYSAPIMIVICIIMLVKTKNVVDSLLMTIIIYGMGILLLPYNYLMVMKYIGKFVLRFLGITFEEAVSDMENSGNEVWHCPSCGAQIYQSGECPNCSKYITIPEKSE